MISSATILFVLLCYCYAASAEVKRDEGKNFKGIIYKLYGYKYLFYLCLCTYANHVCLILDKNCATSRFLKSFTSIILFILIYDYNIVSLGPYPAIHSHSQVYVSHNEVSSALIKIQVHLRDQKSGNVRKFRFARCLQASDRVGTLRTSRGLIFKERLP